jgi:hypothetical protein
MVGVRASQRAVYKPSGIEATVEGIAIFVDQPPERKLIDAGQDPVCTRLSDRLTIQDVIVDDDRLANAFVYVKGQAIDSYAFPTPSTEVALAHTGCQLSPRVLGIQTGQTLAVYNLDPTTHNTHPTPTKNAEWNQSQTPYDAPLTKQFSRPELMIPVKCNQHPWEKAYVGVLDHPFFAVTAWDGSFKIGGLPPGDYDLIAWHENYGEQRVKISLRSNESLTQDITFRSGFN